jgi:membrane protease YdiL (CAAX protease family)
MEGGDAPRAFPSRIAGLIMLVLTLVAAWLFFRNGWHRLERAPRRPRVFTPLVGFALLAAFVLLGQIGSGLALQQLGFGPAPPPRPLALPETVLLGLGRYSAEGLVLVVYIALIVSARRLLPERRPSPTVAAAIGGGALLLFWPLASFVGWMASIVVLLACGRPPDAVAHQTLAMLLAADRDMWFLAMIALVLVAAPVLEELFYRGLVQETLVRLGVGRWAAIVATSALFALMHFTAAPEPLAVPGLLASLFVLSLGFGWVYEKTGRLAAPIAMHVLFNAGNLAIALAA